MPPSSLPRYVFATAVVVGLVVLSVSGFALAAADVPGLSSSAAATSAQPTAVDGLDLPERLELDSVEADGTGVARPDAGTAIRQDGLATDSAYEQYLVEERLDRAASPEERRTILDDAVESTNATTRQLRERERAARSSYEAGEISESQLLRELSIVGASAEFESQTLTAIHNHAARLAISGIRPRAEAFLGQLQVRRGQIRSDAASAIAAEQSAMRVYVASGSGGTVLSTIEGSTYEREATRDDHHVSTLEWGIDSDRAWTLKDELYPRFTDSYGFTSISGSTTQRHMYRASGSYDHGDLVSYIDAHSETVVREDQELRLGPALPTVEPQNATNGTATISLQRTYPSGPAKVTVLDDGEPVEDALVRIDGTPHALTDGDGEAWIVLPYDDPEIGATVGDQQVSTRVQ